MTTLAERARSLKLRLVAMTDAGRGPEPLAVAGLLPAGSWLILRHYGRPERSVLAMKLAVICRARRLTLLIAGDFALAERLGAGLHLPEYQAADARIRLRHRRRRRCLSMAAHGRVALRRARRSGADAALLSPIFPTASHPDAKPLGLLALRRLARGARIPVVALGGVTAATLRSLRHCPISGVAAVSGLAPR